MYKQPRVEMAAGPCFFWGRQEKTPGLLPFCALEATSILWLVPSLLSMLAQPVLCCPLWFSFTAPFSAFQGS